MFGVWKALVLLLLLLSVGAELQTMFLARQTECFLSVSEMSKRGVTLAPDWPPIGPRMASVSAAKVHFGAI